jgi:hypothetical protein
MFLKNARFMRPFQVRWQNYKGFVDTGWIDIRPITVLIGPNNAGKSSFITPLLLLKQTLDSRSEDIALITRGDLANVGRFEDVVTDHDLRREIVLGLRWDARTPTAKDPPLPEVPPGAAEFAFSARHSPEIVLTRYEVRDEVGRSMLTRRRRPSGSYTIADIPTKPPPVKQRTRGDRAAVNEQPSHFLFTASEVFASGYDETREPSISPFAYLYAAITFATSRAIGEVLEAASYLGPLRQPLRRVYEISGDPPSDVGTRGEWAPEILYRTPEIRKATLQWMRHFDFGRSFEFETVRDEAFSIILNAGRGMPGVNAADTGFGASQILPLIVQGLVAEGGDSLIITEQPEIHLNPRLQTRVADLFSHIANEGGSILCETHSEHLVMRLRTLVAQGEIDREDLALYFVDRTESGARIRPVPVDEDGRIAPEEWPRGFFQEATKEALALATEQSNRRTVNARRRRR